MCGPERQAILAYLVLFRCDANLVQDGITLGNILRKKDKMFEKFVSCRKSGLTLQDFYELSIQMSIFCSHNIDWSMFKKPNSDVLPIESVIMPYTREEESWLQNQIRIINEAYLSLPAGQDMIEEFTMYSLGVPLSKSLAASGMSMIYERVTRMCRSQPEFNRLPPKLQEPIL